MRAATIVLAMALVFLLTATAAAQVMEEWVVRYDAPGSSPGNYPDWGYAVTTDDAGNIYVTGGSYIDGTDDDCTTIKYGADGSVIWLDRYDYYGEDWGYDIVVDADGSVYVTGLSSSPSNGYDYLTIKYDSDGTRQWVSRFDGADHDNDAAYAIRVDASGNVYVSGRSQSEPYSSDSDYVTIKYDADGAELWTAAYDGPVHGDDRAHAMTIDDAGNVYVTGGSENLSAIMDFATVKYDTDGNELWVVRRDGLFGADGGGWDIALDPAGNVVVMGRAEQDGTDYDFWAVKYDGTGAELWSARYDGPDNGTDAACTMVVDESGAVYVTGRSEGIGTGYDYATVKYDTDGTELWVRRYDGPVSGEDRVYRIGLGGDGCISVTGQSDGDGTGVDYATVKYDADGNVQWIRRYDGEGGAYDCGWALATDGDGNVIVTGKSTGLGTGWDYVTIKYDPAGAALWTAVYAGPIDEGQQDWAYAMAVDDVGNCFVTGGSFDVLTDDDCRTIKYDTDGNEIWSASYDGPASGEDWGYAIAVDGAGCVYVTGLSDGISTGRDYVTIKYDTDGNEQWVSRYDGPAGWYDAAYAIAVDDAGNVYVTGNSAGLVDPYMTQDYATVKYGPDGTQLWVCRYDQGMDDDRAHAVAVDAEGSVYVTGGSYYSGRHDVVTIKYASDGTEQWVQSSLGAFDSDGGGWAIRVGPLGDIWVAGRAEYVSSGYDIKTLRYDSDGTLLWSMLYDGPVSGDDKLCDMVIDEAGNAYVTGYSLGATGYDYATVKYDGDGVTEWVRRYDGPASGHDQPYHMVMRSPGHICLTGKSEGVGTGLDYATIGYSTAGEQEWVMRYDGSAGGEDWGHAIGADGAGNVYVTGRSEGIGTGSDYATIKYAVDTGTPVEGYCYAVVAESGGVRVRWSVASLVGIQAFDVWRATSEEGPFTRINEGPLEAESSGVFDDTSVWPDTRFWYEVRARMDDGGEEVVSGGPVSVRTDGSLVTVLHPAAPNPTAGSTTLHFDLADHSGPVSLVVYNARGQIVKTVVNEPLDRGRYVRTWDGSNGRGQPSAAGVYFIRLTAGETEETAKVLLVR